MESIIQLHLIFGIFSASFGVVRSEQASMASPPASPSAPLYCTDWKGNKVAEGEDFTPNGQDLCKKCVCNNGFSIMCAAVQCSPPNCEQYIKVEDECCEFHCTSPPMEPGMGGEGNSSHPSTDGNVDSSDLGLRLVASTVTTLLILALLLFMIHRLRQRRLLIMMRRLNSERQDDDAVAYMTNLDSMDIGIEFPPFEDPPPPYSPPKPPDIPHGEPPPPYEEHPSGGSGREINGRLPPGAEGSSDTSRSAHLGGRSVLERIPNSPDLIPMERIRREPSLQDVRVDREILRGSASCHDNEDDTIGATAAAAGPFNENYGLSVAVAALPGGADNNSRQSHMVVHMHNNSPRSSLLRCSTEDLPDVHASTSQASTTEASSSTAQQAGAMSRLQYIKRSDSMEIKRGSNSPRNSFYSDDMDGPDINANPRRPVVPPTTNQGPKPDVTQQTKVKKLAGKSFRIKDGFSIDSPKTKPKERHCISEERERPTSFTSQNELNRHSMPPVNLFWPESNCGQPQQGNPKDQTTQNTSCAHPYPSGRPERSAMTLESPQGACGGGSGSSGGNSLGQSPSVSQSPPSPFRNLFNRSGSINSQLSIFSVCSETGERKLPKPAPSGALRNDVQYPLAPLTSMHTAPVHTPHAGGHSDNDSSDEREPVNTRNSRTATKPALQRKPNVAEAQSGPLFENTSLKQQPSSAGNKAGDRLNPKSTPELLAVRKVIYIDPEELDSNATAPKSFLAKSSPKASKREDSSSSDNTLDGGAKARKDKTRSKVKKSEACSNPMDKKGAVCNGYKPKDPENTPTSKFRKRRSHGGSPGPGVTDHSTTDAQKDASENTLEGTPLYKQYGFIDNPDVLQGMENAAIVPAEGDHVHSPHTLDQALQRRNSKDRGKRESSGERNKGRRSRENSRERPSWKEGQRSRSNSAKGESPSNRCKKHRSVNLGQFECNDIQNGKCDVIQNGSAAAFEPIQNDKTKMHKSRSPNRQRKCKSVGERELMRPNHFPPVDNVENIASQQQSRLSGQLDNAHVLPSDTGHSVPQSHTYRISDTRPRTDNYRLNSQEYTTIDR